MAISSIATFADAALCFVCALAGDSRRPSFGARRQPAVHAQWNYFITRAPHIWDERVIIADVVVAFCELEAECGVCDLARAASKVISTNL